MTDGQVSIVTGAGSGIGFEIARHLLAKGDVVILNELDAELCEQAAAKLNREFDSTCLPVAGDASDLSVIDKLVEEGANHGELVRVVANAGITSYGDFLSCDLAQFRALVNLNLQGSFFVVQSAAKQMIKQNLRGRMLLMSSVTGVQAHPSLAAYGMTKAALSMLARALVPELAQHGILVNAIAPGAVQTERTLAEDPKYAEKWGAVYPTGRTCLPKDIATAATFLLSEQNEMINGQTLIVDGGWTSLGVVPADIEFPT